MRELQTESIQNFLRTAYSDEGLTALLAHAEDGKLSYSSCCCITGSATADHALYAIGEYCQSGIPEHLTLARSLPFGAEAEKEFLAIGLGDDDAIAVVIPLIQAELLRRENERIQSSANILDVVEVV